MDAIRFCLFTIVILTIIMIGYYLIVPTLHFDSELAKDQFDFKVMTTIFGFAIIAICWSLYWYHNELKKAVTVVTNSIIVQ